MIYPCICEGRNKNCKWCDGSGVVNKPQDVIIDSAEKLRGTVPVRGYAAREIVTGVGRQASELHRKCPLCFCRCESISELNNHIAKSHNGRSVSSSGLTVRIRCPECLFSFQDYLQFFEHMKKMHTELFRPGKQSRRHIVCAVCGEACRSIGSLRSHLAARHAVSRRISRFK